MQYIGLIPLIILLSALFVGKTWKIVLWGLWFVSFIVIGVILSNNYISKEASLESQDKIKRSSKAPKWEECVYMMNDTLDLMKKNREWTECLIDIAKGGITESRAEECRYMWELHDNTAKEWVKSYNHYFTD